MFELLTIPFSHYCEKARWALDYTETPYKETARLPVFHMIETVRRGGRSTPLLVRPEQSNLVDSTDILLALHQMNPGASLYPTDMEAKALCVKLEDYFDERLGPALRFAAYSVLLPRFDVYKPYFGAHGSALDQQLFKVVWPAWLAMLRSAFKPSQARFEKYSQRILEIYDEVEGYLDDGRPYLCGEHFTAADLTFSALTASILSPPEYLNGLGVAPADMPAQWIAFADQCRAHTAGQFVLRMYRQHRRVV